MFKTTTTIALTVIGVLFGMQNFDHVPVYLFWGKAIHIRLIFVVAIAGVGGYLIRHFIGLAREDAIKRRFQAVMMKNNGSRRAPKKRSNPYDDQEEEF